MTLTSAKSREKTAYLGGVREADRVVARILAVLLHGKVGPVLGLEDVLLRHVDQHDLGGTTIFRIYYSTGAGVAPGRT